MRTRVSARSRPASGWLREDTGGAAPGGGGGAKDGEVGGGAAWEPVGDTVNAARRDPAAWTAPTPTPTSSTGHELFPRGPAGPQHAHGREERGSPFTLSTTVMQSAAAPRRVTVTSFSR